MRIQSAPAPIPTIITIAAGINADTAAIDASELA
jgi:hypothetical protein